MLTAGKTALRSQRWNFSMLLWTTFALMMASGMTPGDEEAAGNKLPAGIVDEEPARGRSVSLDDGTWMVPYQETIADGLSFLMVPIPGGQVTIGSPGDELGRRDDEGPQVIVTIAPYWIGAMEVSWSEYSMYEGTYRLFKQKSHKPDPGELPIAVTNVDAVTAPTLLYEPEFTKQYGGEAYPAVSMTHFGAMQYSKWLTLTTGNQYRLPTEVEWEHACRAGTSTAYSFGDEINQLAKFARCAIVEKSEGSGPLPVGSSEPNAWGLHDMHGNVSEWVLDQYAADAYKKLSALDPESGPIALFGMEIYPYVIRGGSWMDSPEHVRSAVRFASSRMLMAYDADRPQSPHWHASEEALGIGCRLARSARPESEATIVRFWNPDPDVALDVDDRLNQGRGAIGIPDARGSKKSDSEGGAR